MPHSPGASSRVSNLPSFKVPSSNPDRCLKLDTPFPGLLLDQVRQGDAKQNVIEGLQNKSCRWDVEDESEVENRNAGGAVYTVNAK